MQNVADGVVKTNVSAKLLALLEVAQVALRSASPPWMPGQELPWIGRRVLDIVCRAAVQGFADMQGGADMDLMHNPTAIGGGGANKSWRLLTW